MELINAKEENRLEEIFKEHAVNIIFHTAAYKHVSLVEANPLEGIRNNLLTTYAICNASKNSGVKKMILISSDKAVNPSNIMGSTKLISELIMKIFYKKQIPLIQLLDLEM